ncbi:MAG: hypothetical protein ACNI27_06035 [Desulfovibrio sp.]
MNNRFVREILPAIALVAAWGEFIYFKDQISIYWGIGLVFITSAFLVLMKERYYPTGGGGRIKQYDPEGDAKKEQEEAAEKKDMPQSKYGKKRANKKNK